jgi:glycosyltransferase involved in cell wall biosynthesis
VRVGFITDIPTPYRDPLLARLHRQPGLDLQVTYCAVSFVDRDWRLPELGFPARVLVRRGVVRRNETVLTYLIQPEIAGIIWRGRYDLLVVSSFAQPTSVIAMVTARLLGLPYAVVCESHARKDRSRTLELLRGPLLRQLLGHAAGGFATGSLARAYLHDYGIPEDRLFFLPNTPDVDRFRREATAARPRRDVTRARLRTAATAPVAIFVGRLLAIKEVDTLLEAWSLVRERRPDAMLWVVGAGPERARLLRRAGDGVRFAGFCQQEELPALYAAADCFVLPSRDEPWGVVVNEAAACGLPLVTSDRVGAAADLVHQGQTGYTFPAGDARALAARLLAILGLPDRGASLGAAARRVVSAWGYDFAEAQFLAGVAAMTGSSGR